jgi:hypothetical protein
MNAPGIALACADQASGLGKSLELMTQSGSGSALKAMISALMA